MLMLIYMLRLLGMYYYATGHHAHQYICAAYTADKYNRSFYTSHADIIYWARPLGGISVYIAGFQIPCGISRALDMYYIAINHIDRIREFAARRRALRIALGDCDKEVARLFISVAGDDL